MIVDVLGLGESLSLYDYSDNIRIGVNDICSKLIVDYVVCVDKKAAFTPERLKWIENARVLELFSQLDEWNTHPNFKKIELSKGYPSGLLTFDTIPKSVFSPYIAVGLAWKLFEPEQIRVFGVDMVTHKLNEQANRIISDWLWLKKTLNNKGCEVTVFGNGILKEVKIN